MLQKHNIKTPPKLCNVFILSHKLKIFKYISTIYYFSTIFKTFDSDVDKISAKWGVFGRSFNDIGNAITNKLVDFNDEFERTGKIASSWKNTDSIWKRLYGNKDELDWKKNSAGDIITNDNIDSLIPQISLDGAKDKVADIVDWNNEIKAGNKSWQDYFDTLGQGEQYIVDVVKNTDDLTKLTGEDLVRANQNARQAAIQHNAALKQQTLGARAATGALNTLKAVGNTIWWMAIIQLASELLNGLNELAHADEKRAEEAQERMQERVAQLEEAKQKEEDAIKTSKELSDLFNSEDWGADSAKQAADIYNQMADALAESNNADEERIKLLREEAKEIEKGIYLSKQEREEKAAEARYGIAKNQGWLDYSEDKVEEERRLAYDTLWKNMDGASSYNIANPLNGSDNFHGYWIDTNDIWNPEEITKEIGEILGDLYNTSAALYSIGGNTGEIAIRTGEDLQRFIYDIAPNLKDILHDKYGYEYADIENNEAYQRTMEFYEAIIAKGAKDHWEEVVETTTNNGAVKIAMDYIFASSRQGKGWGEINSVKELEEIKTKVSEADYDEGIVGYVINFLAENGFLTDAYYTDEKNYNISYATPSKKRMTLIEKNAEGATKSISMLSDAWQEMSKEGYLSTETLNNILTQFADVDGIEGYVDVLSRCKFGSKEFNSTINELTYSSLKNALGTAQMTEENEDLIATMLREKGVRNANAVAHQSVARAQAEEIITKEKLIEGTENEFATLLAECSHLDLTKEQLYSLIAAEIALDENNLDPTQKKNALMEIALAAGMAESEVNGLFDAIANLSADDRVKRFEAGGWEVDTSHPNAWGKYNGQDVYGYVYINKKTGEFYDTPQDASLAFSEDQIITRLNNRANFLTPHYPSGSSSGGSDPKVYDDTEARIRRINSEASKLDKTAEELQSQLDMTDEERDLDKAISLTKDLVGVKKQQIDSLKEANTLLSEQAQLLRDSNPYDEESWFDSNGEFTEAYYALLNSVSADEQEAIEELAGKIQKYKQAWLENTEEIKSLNKEIFDEENNLWDLRLDKAEGRKDAADDYIKHSNEFGWENGDSEISARVRILEWAKSDEARALFKNEDEYYDFLEECMLDYRDALENTVSEVERHIDKIKEAKQDEIDMEEALLSIREKSYETLNKLAEAQHEADKAIRTSRISYQYLDEDMIDQIYNEDDYKKVSRKIAEVGGAVDKLTNDFLEDINQAYEQDNLYLIESITAEYERQCALKERELEILQAEIDLQKKQEQLNNVLAEKNVRLLKDGKWVWTHNADNARQAMEELSDAQYEYERQQKEHQQQLTLDSQQRLIDGLTSEVSMLDSQVEKLNDVVENITDPLTDFSTLIDSIVSYGNSILSGVVEDVGKSANSVGGIKYSSSKGDAGYYNSDPAFDYTNAIANAKTEEEVRQLNNERNNKIDQNGLSYHKMGNAEAVDYWKSKRGYASGTKHALPGVADFNEGNKLEGLITNDGTLIPMANFAGGEMVFSHEMMENLWHHAQIPWNIRMPNTPSFELRTPQTVDGGQSFYGDINVYNPTDWNDFMRQLNIQTKSQNAITNKM